jgi:hypothetical protein
MDELVGLFMSVTNTTSEETAKQFLELTAGNLDYAVTLYMEAHPGGGNGSELDEAVAKKLQEEAYGDEVREADVNVHRHETLVDGFGIEPSGFAMNHNRPTDIFGNGRVGIFNQRFDDAENEYYQQRIEELEDDDDDDDDENDYHDAENEDDIIIIDSDGDDENEPVTRPMSRRNRLMQERQAQLTSTQRRLANLFRPPFDIMTVADLDTARQKGKAEKKWLLVNIQDPSEFQSQVLNRDFWSNSLIKSIVQQNFIFLQYQNNSPNGINYINFYHTDTFPHIAILDSWTGERLKCWKDGEVPDVRAWSREVEQFLSEFSLNPSVQNPMVHHETKFDPDLLTEEQQIEFAIKHSLASSGSNENNTIDVADDDEEIEVESNLDPFDAIIAKEHLEPQESSTRLQIRFPNGKRLVHKFALNDTVLEIYQWLKYVLSNNLEDYGLQSNDHFNLTNSSNRTFKFIDSLNSTIEESNLRNASILLEKDQ